jgi:hypothetical protein
VVIRPFAFPRGLPYLSGTIRCLNYDRGRQSHAAGSLMVGAIAIREGA